MSKTFTLGQAQTLLPVVETLLRKAREGQVRAAELEYEMQQLSQRLADCVKKRLSLETP